jgi:hypothetical protein
LKNLLIQQIRVVREVLAISNNIIGNIIAKTIQSQQYRTSLQSNNMDQNLAILLLCPGLQTTANDFFSAGCQSNCVLEPKPPGGSPSGPLLGSRVIGYYEVSLISYACITACRVDQSITILKSRYLSISKTIIWHTADSSIMIGMERA